MAVRWLPMSEVPEGRKVMALHKLVGHCEALFENGKDTLLLEANEINFFHGWHELNEPWGK